MQTYSYQLRFLTPTFLGNAEQQAQWRTPPIKALVRQWWRAVIAKDTHHDVDRMRRREGVLFGTAADDGDSRQSLIRIRLSHWNQGQLRDWDGIGTLSHPNVTHPIGADLYLGFGPLENDRAGRRTSLKNNRAAIQAGGVATLRLALPPEHAAEIQSALELINLYGTLGGRSRNGWGSLSLHPADAKTPALRNELNPQLTRPWQDALSLDWPHAVGADQKGALVWQTAPFPDWKQAMHELARLKIGLRTQFKFSTGKDAPRPEARHWLAYPVTNHSVMHWGGNQRLPNSLRFKLRSAPDDARQCVGVIFHMPCKPPPIFKPDLAAIQTVWHRVHEFLDQPTQGLTRIAA